MCVVKSTTITWSSSLIPSKGEDNMHVDVVSVSISVIAGKTFVSHSHDTSVGIRRNNLNGRQRKLDCDAKDCYTGIIDRLSARLRNRVSSNVRAWRKRWIKAPIVLNWTLSRHKQGHAWKSLGGVPRVQVQDVGQTFMICRTSLRGSEFAVSWDVADLVTGSQEWSLLLMFSLWGVVAKLSPMHGCAQS